MNKTNISWCDYTWNPVTGCKRGCTYCYAKRVHDRFNNVPFSDIVFHEERLVDKDLKKIKNKVIFVGSMSDPEFWEYKHIDFVVNECNHSDNTFMFLSKCFNDFYTAGRGFLNNNVMCGLTLDCHDNSTYGNLYDIEMMNNCCHRPFISIEPLLGCLTTEFTSDIEMVIVGAMTGPKAIKPRKEWIQSIIDRVNPDIIHWKPNIWKYCDEYGINIPKQVKMIGGEN